MNGASEEDKGNLLQMTTAATALGSHQRQSIIAPQPKQLAHQYLQFQHRSIPKHVIPTFTTASLSPEFPPNSQDSKAQIKQHSTQGKNNIYWIKSCTTIKFNNLIAELRKSFRKIIKITKMSSSSYKTHQFLYSSFLKS